MNRIRKYISVMFVMAAVMTSMTSAFGGKLDEAAAAYGAGKYDEALRLYDEVEQSQGVSSQLLYNKGQAYTKSGNLGEAMLCYRRALRLDPSNSNARHNAAYIAERVAEANKAELKEKQKSVLPDEGSFFTNLKRLVTGRVCADTWSTLAGIAFVLFCLCAAIYVFTKTVLLRKIGFFGGGALLGLCIIFLIFGFMGAAAFNDHDEGVVTEYKAELLADPAASAKKTGGTITRGTVMKVLDTHKSGNGKEVWYKVRLNDDFVGWLPEGSFDII